MSIEFDAEIKNGKITIPQECLKQLGGCKRVHVTIHIETSRRKKGKVDMLDYLMAHPVHLEGFRPLTREEVHDRTRK